MIRKMEFSIDTNLITFLKKLKGHSLGSLYAPQCVSWINKGGKRDTYLGDKVIISFNSLADLLILGQYKLNDKIFLDKTNNINFDISTNRLIDVEPALLSRGFYYDFSGDKILNIEVFALHSQQVTQGGYGEISISDAQGRMHYFIDIKCSYMIQFVTQNENLNLMLDNERYFSGGYEDFICRFRILENSEAVNLIDCLVYSSDEKNIRYEKIFSTSEE
jgi:hypothetical protein